MMQLYFTLLFTLAPLKQKKTPLEISSSCPQPAVSRQFLSPLLQLVTRVFLASYILLIYKFYLTCRFDF